MKLEVTPKIYNSMGLPVDKAVEWAERARDCALRDDGERMFLLIFEIWKTAQKHVKKG